MHGVVSSNSKWTPVMAKPKREADGSSHSKPGSIDQQLEDTFPASDATSFPSTVIGAPANRSTMKRPARNRRAKRRYRSTA